MQLGPVMSHGTVLSSVHPYPRACKLLRRLPSPGGDGLSPLGYVLFMRMKGEKTFSPDKKGIGVQRSRSFHLEDTMPIIMP
jgi:hypothetical protein